MIDAFPLIYQSFYAYKNRPLFTSFGLNTSPIMNFSYFLINLLNKENPQYMGVIFDGNQISFRKKKYKKYKSNRKKTPNEIYLSIPYIHKILKAFQIFFIHSKYGYEADDIIGTLANQAEYKGYIVYIISFDKDFIQLVTENIKIYIPPYKGQPKRLFQLDDVKKKFKINHPKQIIDLWSMIGDPSDNIPGIPGIGKINAQKFIQQYGSIENLFNSIHQLDKKKQEKIRINKNIGFLSKKLITIVNDIPYINFNEKKFYIKKPILSSIKEIFEKLEFKRLFKIAYQYYQKKNQG